ncbi:potassium channel family protein [Paracoccus beibuensis]|uniref:potassium channel family protein n=1 Tax=Paracoccus beibuensis TaxID=547602 RepID=UPI002240C1C2|nr:potassium channel family protein [Paracoccus beibuensis]
MLGQIAFGSVLMVVSVLVAGMAVWALETVFARCAPWLMRAPHRPKLILLVVASSIAVLAMLTASVWLWAATFHLLGVFASFEEAMYFTLVTFTTLGYGDVLMPQNWRILGGMAAANGLLYFGLMTAFMVEALRHVRVRQIEFTKG